MGVAMGDEESTLDAVERRLLEWSAWLKGGKTGGGYPVTNVLHESWLPPAPGQMPTMQHGGHSTARERELHGLVKLLSVRLQNTLVVVYLMRASPAEQAERLGCQPVTVRSRVGESKRELWRLLNRA